MADDEELAAKVSAAAGTTLRCDARQNTKE